MASTVENCGCAQIKEQIYNECKKLGKYFFADPKVDCQVLSFKRAVSVKISLDSGPKYFTVEVHGINLGACINKAINRLMRTIDLDRNVSLRRDGPVEIKKFNFKLLPEEQLNQFALSS